MSYEQHSCPQCGNHTIYSHAGEDHCVLCRWPHRTEASVIPITSARPPQSCTPTYLGMSRWNGGKP